MLRVVRAIDRGVAAAETAVLMAVVLAMAALAVIQAGCHVLGDGREWPLVLVRYLAMWAAFLGAALGARQSGHFTAAVAARLIPRRVRRAVSAAIDLSAAAGCALLLRIAVPFLERRVADASVAVSLPLPDGGALDLPEWAFASVVPIALALTAWHFLARASCGAPAAPPQPTVRASPGREDGD